MKITCNQEELVFFLQSVIKVIPQRSTIPVLEGVLLESNKNRLNISATNLEMGIKNYLNIEQQKEGAVVLPGKFSEIIRLLPENKVELKVDENFNTLINCGKSKYLIKGIDPAEYPKLPEWSGEEDFQINFIQLKEMIKQTIFSVSQNEGKPALLGIHFSLKGEVLTFISTDSFRISLRRGKVKNISGKDHDFTVPVKVLNELVKLNSSDENIKIKVENNKILFKIDEFLFYSMLSEETFPQVERIIPSEFNTKVKISKKEFLKAQQRVIVISENNNYVSKLEIKNNVIILKANSNIGSIEEEVEVEKKGHDLDIYFNTRFIIEPLRVIDSEEIVLNLIDSSGPCVISGPEDTDNYLYLILPIKR